MIQKMMNFKLKRLKNAISDEIYKKASLDKKGIEHWLQTKNLISEHEKLITFDDIQTWERAGGETYSTIFEFETNRQLQRIFVKAIVTTNPEKTLIDWKKRREYLKNHNFPVSKWFWTGEATIFEQYYPYDTKSCDPIKLLEIAFKLDTHGFTTLKFIDDLRCDKNNTPFIVDYGFDLGDPSNNISNSAYNYFSLKYPQLKRRLDIYYDSKQNS